MSDWDSADALKRFKDEAGLETACELDDATDIYPLISDGQEEVARMVAARYPQALYQAPTLLTAVSGRKTFTFGTVNGQLVMPMGWVQISPRLSAFTGDTFSGWVEGRDFVDEGTQIRIVGDRSYSGDLYGRWVPRPARVTASVAISLLPLEIGVPLSVNRAVRKWAKQGNQAPSIVKAMDEEFGYPVGGQNPGLFAEAMLTYKRRFRGGGGMIDPAQWYLSPDLG